MTTYHNHTTNYNLMEWAWIYKSILTVALVKIYHNNMVRAAYWDDHYMTIFDISVEYDFAQHQNTLTSAKPFLFLLLIAMITYMIKTNNKKCIIHVVSEKLTIHDDGWELRATWQCTLFVQKDKQFKRETCLPTLNIASIENIDR